ADQINFLTVLHVCGAMETIDQRVDAIWAEFGLDEWRSQAHRDAPDFQAFAKRCPLDWDRLYFQMLRKHGEAQIGRLYRTDREGFEARLKAGREFFFPAQPKSRSEPQEVPEWLIVFVQRVIHSGCIGLPW